MKPHSCFSRCCLFSRFLLIITAMDIIFLLLLYNLYNYINCDENITFRLTCRKGFPFHDRTRLRIKNATQRTKLSPLVRQMNAPVRCQAPPTTIFICKLLAQTAGEVFEQKKALLGSRTRQLRTQRAEPRAGVAKVSGYRQHSCYVCLPKPGAAWPPF